MNPEVLEVSRRSFMAHYAPFEPTEADVQACLKKLKSASLVRSKDGRTHFSACNGTPSSLLTAATACSFLSKLCHAIGRTQIRGREATCELECTTAESEASGVDGYFTPCAPDVAAKCEWKLRSAPDEIFDNRLKAVACASDVLCSDPRRMFTYSITIEDQHMTLWYWSRTHAAKSASFEFTKNVPATVGTLVSFLFASMDELGYDPSIQRRLDSTRTDQPPALVFQVQDRYFKSLKAVSGPLGLSITGRATRVFEVIEVKGFDDLTVIGESSKILKDVWLDVEARTERQIQDAIFRELDGLTREMAVEGSPEAARFASLAADDKELVRKAVQDQRYKQHFLSIECDQQGAESKAVADDAVPSDDLFCPTTRIAPRASLSWASPGSGPRRNAPTAGTARNLQRYVPKRQYRVVYSEVCQDLCRVSELATVFRAMRDCLLAVELLFLVGWVHRDISAGNLLWFPGCEERGILSDLEYAKKFNPDGQGCSDLRTGTPYFMSIEIQRCTYVYNPEMASEAVSTDSLDLFPIGMCVIKAPPIIYNFQHDLDSFFWLFLWAITARIDNPALHSLVDLVFQNTTMCSLEREHAFAIPNRLAAELEHVLPESLRGLAKYVEAFRFHLLNAYWARKFDIGDFRTYRHLYTIVRKILDACTRIAAEPGVPRLVVYSAREDLQSSPADRIPFESRRRTSIPLPNTGVSYQSHKSERSERAEKRETKKRRLGL